MIDSRNKMSKADSKDNTVKNADSSDKKCHGNIVAMLDKMVPSKEDQQLMKCLAKSQRWDTLEAYYSDLKIDKSMAFKLEAILNYFAVGGM